jgi:hypothetical protein
MDTMRWLISSLLTVALAGIIIGCHHIAGSCDCDNHGTCDCTGSHYGGVGHGAPMGPGAAMAPGAVMGPVGKAPETLKEMPKTDTKTGDTKDGAEK